MAAFVSALKSEYGDNVAQMASSRLQGPFTEGKPLTAYMVKQVTAEARTAAAGVFLSGVDFNGNKVEHSLDAALNAHFSRLDANVNPEAFSPEQKDALDALKSNIAQDLLSGRKTFNSAQEIFTNVKNGALGGVDLYWLAASGPEASLSQPPGALADKARLCLLLRPDNNIGDSNVSLAVWRLGQMRAEQPEGPLTPATIWKACFNEALPPEASAGPGALVKAMNEKVQAMQESHIAGLPPHSGDKNHIPYKDCVSNAMSMLPFAALEAARQGSDIDGPIALPGSAFHKPDKKIDVFRMLGENKGLLNAVGGESSPLEFSFKGRDGASETVSMTRANMVARAFGEIKDIAEGRKDDPQAQAVREFSDSFHSAFSAFAGEGEDPLPAAQANSLFFAMGQNGNFVLRRLETAIGVPFEPEKTSYAMGLSHGDNGDVILRHSISDVAVTPEGERTQTERSHFTVVIHADGTVEGNPHVHVSAPRQPA
jgi:hypothetical protein